VSISERYLHAHGGDATAAARALGRGVMAGDPAAPKAGYGAANALLAARDTFALTDGQADLVLAHLHGFADRLVRPDELEHGRTVHDPDATEAYDEGVRLGRALAGRRAHGQSAAPAMGVTVIGAHGVQPGVLFDDDSITVADSPEGER
jgi:hypothetical protein